MPSAKNYRTPENVFDSARLQTEITQLEKEAGKDGLWDNPEAAQKLFSDLKEKKETLESYQKLHGALGDAEVFLEMLHEEPEEGVGYEREWERMLKALSRDVSDFALKMLLRGPYDHNNAIVSIHAGAGGLEAQDWAEMLLRMYKRYLSDKGYQIHVTDYNQDTEGGIKSVTMMVTGANAYGFLKGEKGVHRLVRISPFDTSNRRHTSFASVDVYPQLENDTTVTIDPKDLKIDTYRASGAGGQHVNTTDSAVRITHIPTGVIVQCQSERSQISNRETALKMLKAKLVRLKEEAHKETIEELMGTHSRIAWGAQIRSYVFQPYTLVKDHRTGYEVGYVDRVMDGEIDDFIAEYLAYCAKNEADGTPTNAEEATDETD